LPAKRGVIFWDMKEGRELRLLPGTERDTSWGARFVGPFAPEGKSFLTNFGALERLCVNGSPVGRRFAERGRNGEREAPEGSCIVVIGTDAPILPAQCERVARRAGLGLARTGSVATHGSGEIFVAFSTGCRVARDRRGRVTHDVLADRELDGLFEAAVDATEEAVLDSLFRATTTAGRNGRVAEALPIDELLELM
jgi:D-aminopeptidase